MKVPPWGWPWHGAADLSLNLHRSDGAVVSLNLTGRDEMHTYRLKVPGVAPVERTAAELADDAAAGREWRDEAIFHGRTLYAKRIGGWIYCAPDGSRWVIQIPDLTAGESSRQVGVKRFGELAGKPVARSLEVTWPTDDGLSFGGKINLTGNPDLEPTTTVYRSLLPLDISPDGSRAIYMMYVTRPGAQDYLSDLHAIQQCLPVGFQVVTVSGGLDGVQVEATTLRTMEQTLGTVFFDDSMTVEEWTNRGRIGYADPRRADVNRLRPDAPGTSYWNNDLQAKGADNYLYVNGTLSKGVNNRIVALWFSTDGEVVECTVSERTDYVITEDHPYSKQDPDSPLYDRWFKNDSFQRQWETELFVGGQGVAKYTETITSSRNSENPEPNSQYRWERDDGQEFVEAAYYGYASERTVKAVPRDWTLVYAGSAWRILSNSVVVLIRENLSQDGIARLQYHGFATPRGPFPAAGVVEGQVSPRYPAGPMLYARYNPFTGEVSDPIGNTRAFI